MAKFDKVIPPGQEGKIDMAVDGTRVHGTFLKTAKVRTNDPIRKTLTIGIAGKEIPFVSVQPEASVLLRGGYGEPSQARLTVRSNEKDVDFEVLGLSSNVDDMITYTWAPTQTPGEYAVNVYKNPTLPTLTRYGTLSVHSNSKRAPRTDIQVNVMTRGSILISPILVNFGPVRFGDSAAAGEAVTRSVMLSKPGGEFDIRDIEVTNANFSATAETVTPNQQYRVQVTFHPPAKRADKHNEMADVIIHTNDSQEPAIRVQVVARAM